jgi:O-antigen/teichoic acid export membrane protein
MAHLAGAIIAARSLRVVFAVLIRRTLDPTLVGVWNLIEVLAAYLVSITIGTVYAAERSVPHYRAQGDEAACNRAKESALSWNLAEGVAVAMAVGAYALFFGHRHAPEIRTALYWLPAIFLAHKLLSAYVTLLKSDREFRLFSGVQVVAAVLDWSLLAWAFLWGLPGLLGGAAVTGLIKAACLHFLWMRRSEAGIIRQLGLSSLRPHLPFGPKYAAFKALWTMVERVDTLLVGYLLGAAALAHYYLGFQLSRLALEVPLALSYLAYPHIMERFDGTERLGFSNEFLRFQRLNLFVVVPLTLALGYFGSELLIRIFLPNFVPAIQAVKVSMLAVGVLAVRYLYYQVFNAHQRIGAPTTVVVAQLPVFIGAYFAVRAFVSDTLVVVAIAAVVAHTFSLCLTLWTARPLVAWPERGPLRHWSSSLWICLSWVGLVLGVDESMPGAIDGTFLNQILQFALRTAAFLGAALFFAWIALGRQDLLRSVRQLLPRNEG